MIYNLQCKSVNLIRIWIIALGFHVDIQNWHLYISTVVVYHLSDNIYKNMLVSNYFGALLLLALAFVVVIFMTYNKISPERSKYVYYEDIPVTNIG